MAWEIDCRDLADRVLTEVSKANENDAADLADKLQTTIDDFVSRFAEEEDREEEVIPPEPPTVDPSKRDEDVD